MTLLVSCILWLTRKRFANYLVPFLQHAIITIRFAGIIGISWFLIYIIIYYSANPDAFDHLFRTGNNVYERLVVWVIFLRFPLLFGLTQLFWIQKVRTKTLVRNCIAVCIMFVAVLHGRFLEKAIIIMSSFHRDYLPSNYTIFEDAYWQQTAYFMGISSIIFTLIVFIQWGISEIINRLKRKNV